MATQSIPQSYELLVQLFEEAANGTREHGAAVGLKQNTVAEIRPELEAIIGRPAGPGDNPPSLLGLKAEWNAAKADKAEAAGALRLAKDHGRTIATACVNTLKVRFGNRWSSKWESAGFSGGTLELPDNPLTVLHQLRAYFTANPDHEVPNLGLDIHVTAAACQTAAEAISDAVQGVNRSTVAANDAKENLEAGLQRARKRLSGLRDELSQLLGRDDKRWYSFGFDRPSDPQTPEVPEGLCALPGVAGGGSLFLEWRDARRAENYRVLVRDLAGNTLVERLVAENQITLTGLAAGQTVSVVVSARNGRGGESSPAPALTVTLA
jgi:hypothetical protein